MEFEVYIEVIFYFKGFQFDYFIEWVVFIGYIFLIFELDGIFWNIFDNEILIF